MAAAHVHAAPAERGFRASAKGIFMPKVIAIMSMSSDGFVAAWPSVRRHLQLRVRSRATAAVIDAMTFRTSQPSADHFHELTPVFGAVLTVDHLRQGRRMGGNHGRGPASSSLTRFPTAGLVRIRLATSSPTSSTVPSSRPRRRQAASRVGLHGGHHPATDERRAWPTNSPSTWPPRARPGHPARRSL